MVIIYTHLSSMISHEQQTFCILFRHCCRFLNYFSVFTHLTGGFRFRTQTLHTSVIWDSVISNTYNIVESIMVMKQHMIPIWILLGNWNVAVIFILKKFILQIEKENYWKHVYEGKKTQGIWNFNVDELSLIWSSRVKY